MTKLNMSEDIQFVPLLAPIDKATNDADSKYVDFTKIGRGQLEFEVMVGVLTATDASGGIDITVEVANVNDTTDSDLLEAAIAFNYRLSSAVGTDSMGALTAATSSGYHFSSTDDGKALLIYVDPCVAAAATNVTDAKYVRVHGDPSDDVSVNLISMAARFIPRHAQASQESSS